MKRAKRLLVLGMAVSVLFMEVASLPAQQKPPSALELFNRAKAEAKEGHNEAALVLYDQILNLIGNPQTNSDKLKRAEVLSSQATALRELSRYEAAEKAYSESLEIYSVFKKDDAVAILQGNLGQLFHDVGRFADAAKHFDECLSHWEKLSKGASVPAATHSNLALSLVNRGYLHITMNELVAAERLLKLAEGVFQEKASENKIGLARCRRNLAILYRYLGQSDQALKFAHQSLKDYQAVFGERHLELGWSLYFLGDIEGLFGKDKEAISHLEEALKICQEGKNSLLAAQCHNNLAWVHKETSPQIALEHLQKAILLLREVKPTPIIPMTKCMSNLGWILLKLGKRKEAEVAFQEAYDLRQSKTPWRLSDLCVSEANLGLLEATRSHWEEAVHHLENSQSHLKEHLNRLLPYQPESEQLEFLKGLHQENLAQTMSLGLVKAPSQKLQARLAECSADAVLRGKSITQPVLSAQNLLVKKAGPDGADLLRIRRELASLTYLGTVQGAENSVKNQLSKLEDEEKRLTQQLLQKGNLAAEVLPIKVKARDVCQALAKLKPKTVLIEIALFQPWDFQAADPSLPQKDAHYVAWVLTAQGISAVVDLGSAKAIDKAVQDVRDEIQTYTQQIAKGNPPGFPQAEASIQAKLLALGQLVLRPLADPLINAENWLISPDGALWLAPWAALPTPENLANAPKKFEYAIEKHQVELLVSGRDLLTPPLPAVQNDAVIFANPDYDMELSGKGFGNKTIPHKPFPELVASADEAAQIEKSLRDMKFQVSKLTERKAREKAYLELTSPPRVLVMSTHGYFQALPALNNRSSGTPLDPRLRSGLALAGVNTRAKTGSEEEDGLLTGLEVGAVNLRGTELVVLSACETGLGDIRVGEGVAGLRQAFQVAGAEAIVSTLWQVPDDKSRDLMASFFKRLAQGKSKAEALREAQIELIATLRKPETRHQGTAHPIRWAGFTLTGRGR